MFVMCLAFLADMLRAASLRLSMEIDHNYLNMQRAVPCDGRTHTHIHARLVSDVTREDCVFFNSFRTSTRRVVALCCVEYLCTWCARACARAAERQICKLDVLHTHG